MCTARAIQLCMLWTLWSNTKARFVGFVANTHTHDEKCQLEFSISNKIVFEWTLMNPHHHVSEYVCVYFYRMPECSSTFKWIPHFTSVHKIWLVACFSPFFAMVQRYLWQKSVYFVCVFGSSTSPRPTSVNHKKIRIQANLKEIEKKKNWLSIFEMLFCLHHLVLILALVNFCMVGLLFDSLESSAFSMRNRQSKARYLPPSKSQSNEIFISIY